MKKSKSVLSIPVLKLKGSSIKLRISLCFILPTTNQRPELRLQRMRSHHFLVDTRSIDRE